MTKIEVIMKFNRIQWDPVDVLNSYILLGIALKNNEYVDIACRKMDLPHGCGLFVLLSS